MEQTKVYLVYKTERLSEVKEMSSLKFGRGVEGRGSYVKSRGYLVEGRHFFKSFLFFIHISNLQIKIKKPRFGQTRDLYLYLQPRLARHAAHVPIRLLVKYLLSGLARFFFLKKFTLGITNHCKLKDKITNHGLSVPPL